MHGPPGLSDDSWATGLIRIHKEKIQLPSTSVYISPLPVDFPPFKKSWSRLCTSVHIVSASMAVSDLLSLHSTLQRLRLPV